MMKRKFNKRKLFCLFLLIMDIFLVCYILILIYSHVDMNKRRRDSFVSSYTESSKVTYQVNMLENDYIKSENFGNSNSYILKYTDNILFHFSYTYVSSRDINTSAHWKIIATVMGSYKKSNSDSNEIYNQKFVLDSGDVTSDSNTIVLDKSAKINVNEYNALLRGLQEDLKLPLVGKMEVVLSVDTEDEEGNAIDHYEQNASVGLLADIYDVIVRDNDSRVRNFYSDKLEIDYVYLFGLGVVFILLVIIFLVLIKFILHKKISKGEEEANKYLRVYDDFIVNIDDPINVDKYQVVMISEFKELLTLANNNSTSILYFNHRDKGMFYVILNEYLYIFVVDYRG